MNQHLDEIDQDRRPHRGEPGRLAQVFEDCNSRRESDRRRQRLSRLWRHRIGGVPTVAWLLLGVAALLSLNLGFGRPWF